MRDGARPGRSRRSVLLSAHNHLSTEPEPELETEREPEPERESGDKAAPSAPAPAPAPAPAAVPPPVDIYHAEDVTEERIQGLEEMMARMHRSLGRVRRVLRRLQRDHHQSHRQRRRHRRIIGLDDDRCVTRPNAGRWRGTVWGQWCWEMSCIDLWDMPLSGWLDSYNTALSLTIVCAFLQLKCR